MFIRQGISVGNLLLDTSNYRIIKQSSQKGACDAIIAEQGKKLVVLAKDIVEHGLNPFDLPLVIDAGDGNQNYIVIEGNRRLTAVNLMLKPELAEGTSLFSAFKRLNKEHPDAIPKVFDCVIAPNKQAGLVWINRKHSNGLEGAGTEPWSSMAKARADAEQGISRPDLDVVNFVLANPKIDTKLRTFLEGAKFNITTLDRLIDTKEVQENVGFSLKEGKLVSNQDKNWLWEVLTDIVAVIANGNHNGKKFTERDIDSKEKRKEFIDTVVSKHSGKKKADTPWVISGTQTNAGSSTKPAKSAHSKSTPSTDERTNLISKKFKLTLPSGKINDIFIELKMLNVVNHRHAVSVLFRVFLELTLNEYIKKHHIKSSNDKLSTRLQYVLEHIKACKLLGEQELKPIHVAIGDPNSLLAPNTLNAYVHSPWMNPEPIHLKLAWNNIEPFVECLWTSINKK